MRLVFCCAVLVLASCASCHNAPDEPQAVHDASPSGASGHAGGAGSTDAAASAEGRDGGHGVARDFCTDAYSADSERLRSTCAPADVARTESIVRIASSLCTRDLSAVLAATATFDRDAAAKCVGMLRDKPMTRANAGDTFFEHFPCDRVLLGTHDKGEPCVFSVECRDGLACVAGAPGANGANGACATPPRTGQPCSLQSVGTSINEVAAELHHPACAVGGWCDGVTCQPRRATGKSCTSDGSCADGLACVMGKCGQRRVEGDECTASSDCSWGLWCGSGSVDGGAGKGQCRAKLGGGSECTIGESCKGRCEMPGTAGGHPHEHGTCVSVCGSG